MEEALASIAPPEADIYRRVVGIDPGTRSGWAMLDSDFGDAVPVLVGFGVIRFTDGAAVERLCEHLCRPGFKPDLVAIEDQYIPKYRANIGSIKSLAERSAMFRLGFERRGVKVISVQPMQWQMALLEPEGLIGPWSRRGVRKTAARKHARRLYGRKAARSSDAADALLIATWTINEALRRAQ